LRQSARCRAPPPASGAIHIRCSRSSPRAWVMNRSRLGVAGELGQAGRGCSSCRFIQLGDGHRLDALVQRRPGVADHAPMPGEPARAGSRKASPRWDLPPSASMASLARRKCLSSSPGASPIGRGVGPPSRSRRRANLINTPLVEPRAGALVGEPLAPACRGGTIAGLPRTARANIRTPACPRPAAAATRCVHVSRAYSCRVESASALCPWLEGLVIRVTCRTSGRSSGDAANPVRFIPTTLRSVSLAWSPFF